jgi:hypothetical protein
LEFCLEMNLTQISAEIADLRAEIESLSTSSLSEGNPTINLLLKRLKMAAAQASSLQSLKDSPFSTSKGSSTDRLKLNVGGDYLDLKRSALVDNPACGWNLLSCLFDERLEKYLLKDRNDRVYFDYELEWFEPVLKCIRDGTAPFRYFDSSLHVKATKMIISQFGLQNSVSVVKRKGGTEFSSPCLIHQITSGKCLPNLDALIRSACENDDFVVLEEVYNSSAKRELRSFSEAFPFICLVETQDKKVYCGLSDQKIQNGAVMSSPITRFARLTDDSLKILRCTTTVISPSTYGFYSSVMFSLSFGKKASGLFYGPDALSINWNGYSAEVVNVGIYRITSRQNSIISQLSAVSPSVSSSSISDTSIIVCDNLSPIEPTMQGLLVSVIDSLNKVIDCDIRLSRLFKELSRQQRFLLAEFEFVVEFLSVQWASVIENFPSPCETQQNLDDNFTRAISPVISKLQLMLQFIDAYYPSRNERTSPIVNWNVEGKKICILKDTIEAIIPQSQLAIRISGRWLEQEQNVDEEGSLILEGTKEVMVKIFSALRAKYLLEEVVGFSLPNQLKADYMEITDYLQIDRSLFSVTFVT